MLTLHISFFIEIKELFFHLNVCLTLIELDITQNQFGYTLEGFGLVYLLLSPW